MHTITLVFENELFTNSKNYISLNLNEKKSAKKKNALEKSLEILPAIISIAWPVFNMKLQRQLKRFQGMSCKWTKYTIITFFTKHKILLM